MSRSIWTDLNLRFAACSTVLVPARVVQALNLNLDELGSAHPRFQGRMFHDHGILCLFSLSCVVFSNRFEFFCFCSNQLLRLEI